MIYLPIGYLYLSYLGGCFKVLKVCRYIDNRYVVERGRYAHAHGTYKNDIIHGRYDLPYKMIIRKAAHDP